MANIPTESRIFADRYCREARRLEALHAGQISPGCTTWGEALDALFERMRAAGGPLKRSGILKAAIAYLQSVPRAEVMHVGVYAGSSGKRSAALTFATFRAGRHPFGLDEDGLKIMLHCLVSGRGCAELLGDVLLTYISRHAMARLHERDYRLAAGSALGVFGRLGILGLITRHSDQHVRGKMCLHFGEVLAVGSLRRAAAHADTPGGVRDATFYDVRTVLPADEMRDQAMLEQGRIANETVADWLKERSTDNISALAERIPFLPRREDDFTLKMAAGA